MQQKHEKLPSMEIVKSFEMIHLDYFRDFLEASYYNK